MVKGWRHCNRSSIRHYILSDNVFLLSGIPTHMYMQVSPSVHTCTFKIILCIYFCLLLLALNTFWAVLMSIHIKLFLSVSPQYSICLNVPKFIFIFPFWRLFHYSWFFVNTALQQKNSYLFTYEFS